MLEFAQFLPSHWVADGMLVAAPAPTRSEGKPRRNAAWHTAFVTSALSLGIALAGSNVVIDRATASVASSLTPHERAASARGDVPPGYWPKLAAAFKKSRVLSHPAADDHHSVV